MFPLPSILKRKKHLPEISKVELTTEKGNVMPFIHAYRAGGGVPLVVSSIATSAFSRGDIVQFDVGSTVSRIVEIFGTDIGGIAMSASVDSINNLVPILVPDAADVFTSDVTAGNVSIRGAEVDIEFNSGRPVVVASTNTPRVVIVDPTTVVLGQSDASRVRVRFIGHSGNIDLS